MTRKSLIITATILALSVFAGVETDAQTQIISPDGTYLFAERDTCTLFMDVYEPAKGSKTSIDGISRPTIIFMFGGGFVGGTRDDPDYHKWFRQMTDEGYRIISIDYRLGLKGSTKVGVAQVNVLDKAIHMGVEDLFSATNFIIENADRMGLAQLYQLRGRVGRSNRTAYAYLTYQRDKILSPEAQKRLSAIREFTEFGSGFHIAMRDLEIRGAGNMLGSEQHGHMDNVGYDMYCKILSESVREAKGITVSGKDNVTVDISVNAYIPESYIPSANQRIDMYKRIAAIENEDDEFEIQDELTDRFGDMPKSVLNLIAVAGLKPHAADIGCNEIIQKGRVVTLKFNDGALSPEIVFASMVLVGTLLSDLVCP